MVVISGVISPLTCIVTILISPCITTHEPPSRRCLNFHKSLPRCFGSSGKCRSAGFGAFSGFDGIGV